MVFEAAREAHFLHYDQLYFFAFAIQAKARELIEERNKDGAPKLRIHCTYVAVTPDVAMSDLVFTHISAKLPESVSGAGKSTLMKILAGYEAASEGSVEIGGQAVSFRGPQRRPPGPLPNKD